jgi:recombination protein RecA
MNEKLKTCLENIEKKLGKGSIIDLEGGSIEIERVSTGSLATDIAIGGGWPLGRISSIAGPESSGKTTLALHTAAEFQQLNHTVGYVDMENSLDIIYAQDIGVDIAPGKFVFAQPDCGEDGLTIAEELIVGGCKLVIVDSVAALIPRAELEGEFGETKMGLQARLMAQAMRKLVPLVKQNDAALLFINQYRMKIGQLFGNPEVETGGEALKYATSVRLDIRKVGQNEKDREGTAIANRIKVRVLKNKTFPPFREGFFDIIYGQGISRQHEVLELCSAYGIIEKKGAWFQYKPEGGQEIMLGQGLDKATEFLLAHSALEELLIKKIKE